MAVAQAPRRHLGAERHCSAVLPLVDGHAQLSHNIVAEFRLATLRRRRHDVRPPVVAQKVHEEHVRDVEGRVVWILPRRHELLLLAPLPPEVECPEDPGHALRDDLVGEEADEEAAQMGLRDEALAGRIVQPAHHDDARDDGGEGASEAGEQEERAGEGGLAPLEHRAATGAAGGGRALREDQDKHEGAGTEEHG